jgi:hypothetical protein
MSELVVPLINGRRFSYASIELSMILGATKAAIFADVEEINYSERLEVAFKEGTARIPLGNTSGKWTPQEGNLVMGKSTFNQMVQQIGPGWLGINLLMTVAYSDIGEALAVDTVVARLVGHENAHSSTPDALKVSVALMPIAPMLVNGVLSMLNRVV